VVNSSFQRIVSIAGRVFALRSRATEYSIGGFGEFGIVERLSVSYPFFEFGG
jgi:hypothetical protein